MSRDTKLAVELSKWFERHERDAHRWRNPAGAVIREWLQSFGNWRNAPRGNPKKGFRAMREKLEAAGS